MEEIIKNIASEYSAFAENAAAQVKGNKAAGTRARKNALALMQLCKEFRKVSVEKDK